MMGSKMKKLAVKVGGILAVTLSTAALQGCYDDRYLAHRDGIELGSGDAVLADKATHAIDPWPEAAADSDIPMDGQRAAVAIKRYEQNKVVPPRGLGSTTVSAQSGPGDQASAQISK